jgi:hypothetical protein
LLHDNQERSQIGQFYQDQCSWMALREEGLDAGASHTLIFGAAGEGQDSGFLGIFGEDQTRVVQFNTCQGTGHLVLRDKAGKVLAETP